MTFFLYDYKINPCTSFNSSTWKSNIFGGCTMHNSIPTNPEKFFELTVCKKCRHRACSSLTTEEMTTHGVFRFEHHNNTFPEECPFLSTSVNDIESYLNTINIQKLNQLYRYIKNEFNLNQENLTASVPTEHLEDKGAQIIALIKDLVIKNKIRAFGVMPNYNNDHKVKWWMRAHVELKRSLYDSKGPIAT